MIRIVLFDTPDRVRLFPLTAIRPVADLLSGILTIRQKWERYSGNSCDVLTESYLMGNISSPSGDTLYINAHLFVTAALAKEILDLESDSSLWSQENLLAFRTEVSVSYQEVTDMANGLKKVSSKSSVKLLRYPWQLVVWNAEAIATDFELLTNGRKSAVISNTNKLINREQIFVESGADIDFCVINASSGPVYIGKDTTIMEGTMIRGPFALLDNATVKMGACIYGGTTIGKHCIAGGEIKQSIIMSYSNKAHHGYLGDAVIGEWCNMGAGTSCSNIKNNAGEIDVFNPWLSEWITAGIKCGVMMGDYSRTAIHTAINTGTVIGICSNIVSNHLTNKYIDSFIWDIATNQKYKLEKAYTDIAQWMKLKDCAIAQHQKDILLHLYNLNPS